MSRVYGLVEVDTNTGKVTDQWSHTNRMSLHSLSLRFNRPVEKIEELTHKLRIKSGESFAPEANIEELRTLTIKDIYRVLEREAREECLLKGRQKLRAVINEDRGKLYLFK